jgi:DNA topoisomerase I
MAKHLLIVESPTKAKTIKRYVGKNYTVKASVGHVKDLPKSKMGIDIENGFNIELVVIHGKKKVLNELCAAAKKVDDVFLAPDPDREGEAIAWHIADEVSKVNPSVSRVTFNEITKKAVKEALKNPRPLNTNLYEAQQARRVLDRLVGYEISPLLWDKVRRGLSAGRVQSVALRLIVEREREIEAFNPVEYWSIDELLKAQGDDQPQFKAALTKIDGEKAKIDNQEQAEKIHADLEKAEHSIVSIEKKSRSRKPSPPFTTSTLQQAAANNLRFTAKKTMRIAQQLYEGIEIADEGSVGLITYMRTDSTRMSQDAIDEARAHIEQNYSKEHLPDKPVAYKSKKGAQDAHEAIRPTGVEYTPEKLKSSLTPEQFKLYNLIWRQFVACQMTPARYDLTAINIEAAERYLLRATGSICVFPGFLAVAKGDQADDEGVTFPVLNKGDALQVDEIQANQHFTQPPPRFSEATLVKEMEEKGIGRPSTYASILDTILSKQYVVKQQSRLHPTELGQLVTELLVKSFPEIMDVDFTAGMEKKLDDVEDGNSDWVQLIKDFYGPFTVKLEIARKEMREVKREEIPTEHNCELCGETMVIKFGRNGYFLACSGYPKCKNTKEIKSHKGNKVEIAPLEDTGEICEKCEKPMIIRRGRYGRFLACSGYPECKNSRSVPTGVDCPQCEEGRLVERSSKRGKLFYACDRYPDCKFSVWNMPIAEKCPECGFAVLVHKETKKDGETLSCPVKGCDFKRAYDAGEENPDQ